MWVPKGVRATTACVQLQCPPWRCLEPQVVPVQGPLVGADHGHLWGSDNCSGLPLQPVDLAWSNPSHLAHAGGAAPAAPSCRVLGRDSDQVTGCCPECLAVAAAGQVCSQGSESNSVWCLAAVSLFFLFCQPLRWLGLQVEPTQRHPVVASHTSLWPLRWPLGSVPGTCRSCKRHHVALSPLAHTRGAWPPVACTRSTQSPLNEQEASCHP